ncbi:hypothetical protein [Brevibacterium otitidis]|uniref:mRNA interferase HicA n=1 Tax=Brevibacterium otitidis TaxID=53364 RepID=A0ABV5X0B1_9MICO|nr:hypothetical protein GCM10023233_28250 [Brevibacterium otitidis]
MTKRRDIIKKVRAHANSNGLPFRMEEGGRHTKVWVGDRQSVIPRHSDINELTAKAIYKQLGVEQ